MLDRPPADELPHHWIAAKTISIIDVLVAGGAREEGLAQRTREAMPSIPASARVGEQLPPPMSVKRNASSSSRWSSNPPSELMEEPRNASLTEGSNCSRKDPGCASPVAIVAKALLRLR